jgi:hypothetical protein
MNAITISAITTTDTVKATAVVVLHVSDFSVPGFVVARFVVGGVGRCRCSYHIFVEELNTSEEM